MGSSEQLASERREHARIDREIMVTVQVAKYQQELRSRNTSDGGLYLYADEKPLPPLRTIVCLSQLETETMLGRIVWVTEDGMGVEYIDKPVNCCKG